MSESLPTRPVVHVVTKSSDHCVIVCADLVFDDSVLVEFEIYGPFFSYSDASDFKEKFDIKGNIIHLKMLEESIFQEKFNPELEHRFVDD